MRPAGKAIAENAEPAADQVDAAVIQPTKELAAKVLAPHLVAQNASCLHQGGMVALKHLDAVPFMR